MDTIMSSVLREANNSLTSNQSWTSQKIEDGHNQDHNHGYGNPQNPSRNNIPRVTIGAHDQTLDTNYSEIYQDYMKQEVLDFSLNSAHYDALTSQRDSRSHSSSPAQLVDMNSQSIGSHVDHTSYVSQPIENFACLYPNISSLVTAETSRLSPAGSDIHMDVNSPIPKFSISRSVSPGDMDNRIPLSGELISESQHLHDDEGIFDGQVGRSTNFESLYPHDYLGQNDNITDLHFDSDHHTDSGYVDPNNSLNNFTQLNGHNWPNTNSVVRRETIMQDIHSVSNSIDSFDMFTDANSKYEDSDYSNMSADHFAGRQTSVRPQQTPHQSSNSLDITKCDFTQSLSKPASINSWSSTPSPSSQTANDSARASPTELEDGQEKTSEGKGAKMKGKGGGVKPRGAQNLPPCRVCGNMASGLHFGVNTCEACNEFFRRSLKRGATYYCSKNRECQVYGKKRNACSYCRYQRCVEMGMSRDAIKTGRYSHKTRTEYAMEVEKFKLKEVNRAEMERYQVLLDDLVKYHDKYVKVTTRVPDEELLTNQTKYLQLYHTQREHERRHPPLKTAQNKRLLDDSTIYQKEDLSLTMHDAEMTEHWLRNYINFAKNVPGFKELVLSDQASLVRGSWFEFWFLGAFRGYNSDLQVVAYPNGRCFHRDEVQKVFGQEYTDFSFYLADRMRTLDVTPEIMVLIKTVCLTFPDRTPLENKEAVDKMHWSMVAGLMHVLETTQTGGSATFPLVVSKLVELRTLTDIAMRAHKSALFQDVLKESPLLSEMVDTKTRYVPCEHKDAALGQGNTPAQGNT